MWQKECANDWILISPGKKRATQALNALKKKPPHPIFKHVQSSELAKKKLVFAENISYSACSGYSAPGVIVPKGIENSSTSLSFGTIDYSPRPTSNVQVSEVPSAPVTTSSRKMHDNSIVGDESFEHMINDMVFQVYECGHCLGFGHNKESCITEIRCRACFFYGHKEKNCLNKKGKSLVWHPKATQQNKTYNPKGPITSLAVSSPLSPASDTLLSSPPSPDRSTSPSAAPMAAFELDPACWVSMGHHLVDGGPTRLPRTFYTPSEDPLPDMVTMWLLFLNPPLSKLMKLSGVNLCVISLFNTTKEQLLVFSVLCLDWVCSSCVVLLLSLVYSISNPLKLPMAFLYILSDTMIG
jgi:hypothetical protein